MTPLRRRPGRLTVLIASLLLLPAVAQAQSGLRETFDHGVELLRSGDRAGALKEFQAVLALDPSHEAAYELWKSTEHEVWLDLLAESGQFELIGKRLMDLARLGREARRDDPEAVAALLEKVFGDDALERRRAILTLGSQHGEFAVPQFLPALADQVDGDRRVLAIHALTEMGPNVVLPLIQVLESDDAFLRRQVAYTLGYIGDPRAVPALAFSAGSDGDMGVADAAGSALARMGGSPDAAAGFIAQGDAYRAGDPSVLGPGMRSSVVWSWDGKLRQREVPGPFYADEMAKAAYYDALLVDPNRTQALVGIAAASASQAGSLEARAAAGVDVADMEASVDAGMLAASAVGSGALDTALGRALDLSDETGAAVLCRLLGDAGTERTGNLQRALGTRGAVSAEAALALGRIALRTGTAAETDAVEGLARAASREILRVAGIIDADAQRVNVIRNELEGRGVLVRSWSEGALGLASVRRAPGFDLIVVADVLPDLTANQVLDDLRSDPRFADVPLVLAAEDAGEAADLFGDLVSGVATTSDLSAIDDALSGEMTGDRARAMELAARSARVLADLTAAGGADLSTTQDRLAGALDRDDSVVVPMLSALGHAGDGAVVDPIAAVVADGERSDETRAAAADALAGIFSRTGSAGEDTTEAVLGVATSSAPLEVRMAAARALGQLGLDAPTRARVLRDLRAAASQ